MPGRRPGGWTARAISHQIGLGFMQYFDDWNGQFFLHHPFNADVLSETAKAESFAEIYWEDKIMPYVNAAYANDAIASGGTQVADAAIFRCMSDISNPRPFKQDDGTIDGIADRTSYLMNSLLTPQDAPVRPVDVPADPVRDRHVEFRDHERAERGRDPRQPRRRRPEAGRLRHLARHRRPRHVDPLGPPRRPRTSSTSTATPGA